MEVSRVGASLKSARERAGWSREALAYRSGLSWAAITQIESGRRRELRLGSLVALASALEVSVDYLVGAEATVSPKLLRHTALIYASDEEFLASTVPFVREGVERAESVLVVIGRPKIRWVRDALGDDGQHVEFRDSSKWMGSATGALKGYRTFVKARFALGAPWIRILGEPVWAGRSAAEVAEWTRLESMFNLSFESSPATAMCCYDARSVPEEILARAHHTHPKIATAGDTSASPAYRNPEEYLLTSA